MNNEQKKRIADAIANLIIVNDMKVSEQHDFLKAGFDGGYNTVYDSFREFASYVSKAQFAILFKN